MPSLKNSKAFLYCSTWPDQNSGLSLKNQLAELQAYCLANNLKVWDVFTDVGSYVKGQWRSGMEWLLGRVIVQDIGHVVIHDVGRIGRDPKEVVGFLRDTFDINHTEVHLTSWNLSTAADDFDRVLSLTSEIISLELPEPIQEKIVLSERVRIDPLWSNLFGMLQDERFAEILIKALFKLKDSANLSEKEYLAVHGGYDHLNMFQALGFRIRGEQTDNTKLVADVLVRNWDKVKAHLGADLYEIIEGSETGIVF